ncbi:hypothetical protein COW36_19935 [bacterium (Candidatus Blackallbacteria) CG17_big_fil_post_rev_8_21_14_2_50_48_46]|uniref:DUF4399 domain-containing protein n=1 Tax=bacterium (Candidatus Blackallbacteria) CG17_big_fil_post_rev_8_21_14_2_50_48_46 TaxID=2014261 RepID=A0A2M7G000_9BACT|nr:MAG: hypothetical protein COW64_15360 [bacterium (Candidatus Blackallbacteria) CG18_big_fil_WC_8_21_14_2_50_49_26]PIW14919.1 MAG: hypothetical protein COW36_19935 [bacterium (Candidatus Blackallbacteria) CG17_big_fil_post_rev_8_21_14_2_50_48_46]PIW44293.1 MAG: hypothetical protein COW20_24425 [bacterium (Candidatus Blackallbacteria) CG13_big_fil_rev_8_21_14_2_50_49_14]
MKSTLLPLIISILALAACAPSENKTENNKAQGLKTQSQDANPAASPSANTEHAHEDSQQAAEAPKAKIFFISPKEGATLKSPIKVEMGIEGMEVAPAGELKAQSGHHHLIIDGQALKAGEVVPKDEQHIHFGKGQTSTELILKPGEHSLTLQFADGTHKSYGPELSSTIHVKVE